MKLSRFCLFVVGFCVLISILSAEAGEKNPATHVRITVQGQVRDPGQRELSTPEPTAFDACRACGGTTVMAGNALLISRKKPDGSIERLTFPLPFRSAGKAGEEALKKIPIRDGDYLYFQEIID